MCKVCAKNHTLNTHDMGTMTTPKLQMRKLWHREVKYPAPGHTARITAQIFLTLKTGILISNSNTSEKGMYAKGEGQMKYKLSQGKERWEVEGKNEGFSKASWRRRPWRWVIKHRIGCSFLSLVSQSGAGNWGLQSSSTNLGLLHFVLWEPRKNRLELFKGAQGPVKLFLTLPGSGLCGSEERLKFYAPENFT